MLLSVAYVNEVDKVLEALSCIAQSNTAPAQDEAPRVIDKENTVKQEFAI